jgi:DNA-binding GntR family transcriptional regulator
MSTQQASSSSKEPAWADIVGRATRGQTAHVFVREAIRVAILNGQLSGGARLVQSDLAAHLDVSTTPVREALRDLASEGLIRIDPHRGGVVNELDEADLTEVYEIRQLLEPWALQLALPNLTDEILGHAEELHVAMNEAPDSAAWVQLNRDFHMTLYEVADRSRLVGMLRSLQDASVMAVSAKLQRVPDLRRTANAEHALLLDALRQGDLEAAQTLVREHLSMPFRA